MWFVEDDSAAKMILRDIPCFKSSLRHLSEIVVVRWLDDFAISGSCSRKFWAVLAKVGNGQLRAVAPPGLFNIDAGVFCSELLWNYIAPCVSNEYSLIFAINSHYLYNIDRKSCKSSVLIHSPRTQASTIKQGQKVSSRLPQDSNLRENFPEDF